MRLRSNRVINADLSDDSAITSQKMNYSSPLQHFGTRRRLEDDKNASTESSCSKSFQSRKRKCSVSLTEMSASVEDSVIILSDNEDQPNKKSRVKCVCNKIASSSKNNSHTYKVDRSDIPLPNSVDIISLLTPEKDSFKEIQNLDESVDNKIKIDKSPEKVVTGKSMNNINKLQEREIRSSQGHSSSWISRLKLEEQSQQVIVLDSENENTEPSKESTSQKEDISVTWMSLKSPSLTKSPKREANAVTNSQHMARVKKRSLIIMDTRGDLANLYQLDPNSKVLTGRQRIRKAKQFARQIKNMKNGSNINVTSKRIMSLNEIDAALNFNANSNESRTDSKDIKLSGKLREIVVDGNNIGMAHSNGKVFSEMGLKLVIDFFKQRGHSVKVFVPQYRRAMRHTLLEELYTEGIVVFTPSRKIGGRTITSYDDRYILEYATMCNGIVISQDQYRDLYSEKPEWRDTIENRLLAPTFVGNYVMFPEDPLGRIGPKLDQFLRH